jgi:hypothetical protein
MRKRYRVLILAAVVAAVVVPVGLALSLESALAPVSPVPGPVVAIGAAPGLGNPGREPAFPGVPDSAKLFFTGAVLCGLAAGVRRALDVYSRSLIAAPQAYNRDVSAR